MDQWINGYTWDSKIPSELIKLSCLVYLTTPLCTFTCLPIPLIKLSNFHPHDCYFQNHFKLSNFQNTINHTKLCSPNSTLAALEKVIRSIKKRLCRGQKQNLRIESAMVVFEIVYSSALTFPRVLSNRKQRTKDQSRISSVIPIMKIWRRQDPAGGSEAARNLVGTITQLRISWCRRPRYRQCIP